jgi:hypothetical protein
VPPSRRLSDKYLRRWLFLIHRWIGIASCLLFCIWFASGLVMHYVPYPSLSQLDGLAGSQRIDWQSVRALPSKIVSPGGSVELAMRDGAPVWRIADNDGIWTLLSASTGRALPPVGRAYARREAARFSGFAATDAEIILHDQWTVGGGFDAHRPLWKVGLNDRAGTILYISSATGSVVQRTTRSARFWNWLGSVPHWIYPTLLRQDNGLWRQVVMWVSGPCIAAAVTGFWIGLLRTRAGGRRYAGGRMTPYHGWMLWHHVAGLAGGLFLIAWIFSGWLSVDPGRIFAHRQGEPAALRRYAGNPMPEPAALARLRTLSSRAVLVQFRSDAGIRSAAIHASDGSRQIVAMETMTPAPLATRTIMKASDALVPGGRRVEAQLVTEPDSYWYAVGSRPILPVLQLRFDDSRQTWLYFDPRTGELLAQMGVRRRLYRWLFDMLHRWDLNIMLRHAPAREMLLWMGSLLGLAVSASGLVLGWRRLARPKGQQSVQKPSGSGGGGASISGAKVT